MAKIIKGFWNTDFDACGSLPPSWEGAKIWIYQDKLYLFGGFSRTVYNDIR